jgi:hypothetical protein
MKDAINPDHYKVGGIETIAYLEAKLSPEEYRGYLRGNALKYLSRAGHKDDAVQEISKAIWYLERLRDSHSRTDISTWNYVPRSDELSPGYRVRYRMK